VPTTSPSVLLVDDEPILLDVLEQYLRNEGFRVFRAADGPRAVESFKQNLPDLVLLDLNLPGFPGIEVLRQIRAVNDTPVIMLTVRAEEIDRVLGLELGADDYVNKPFSPREVLARIRSVLRRTERAEHSTAHVKRIGELTIDALAHEVRLGGELVELTRTQFKVLDILAAHLGQTLTRDQLLQRITADGDVFDRTLDRHIANLRARIEPDPANPRYIVTVFGVGYKMVAPQ